MTGIIDAANVDLKSFSDAFYQRVCGARLQPVLEAIRGMYNAGILVEVTTLVVPDQNDSDEELGEIARFIASVSPDIPWHISRFHPDYEMQDTWITPEEALYRAVRLGEEAGLRYLYVGNSPGGQYEDTACPHCGGTVVHRRGFSVQKIDLDGNHCGHCSNALPFVVDGRN